MRLERGQGRVCCRWSDRCSIRIEIKFRQRCIIVEELHREPDLSLPSLASADQHEDARLRGTKPYPHISYNVSSVSAISLERT